jgi:superfamily II RNA helicase
MKSGILSTSAICLASILVLSGMNVGFAQTSSTASDGRHVNTIAVVTLVDSDRLLPKEKPGTFSYIFEACAGTNDIINPEVIVSSDGESKKIKLAKDLKANECQVSVAKIKSSTKELISAIVFDRGGMTKVIKDLENNITAIKDQLKVEKSNLKNLINEKPEPADLSKKVSEITDQIVKLRKDLDDSRQKYYRTLYLVNN